MFYFSHETIVLSGTRQQDDENTSIDLNDKDGIWQRCLRLCPKFSGKVKLDHLIKDEFLVFIFSKRKFFGIGYVEYS